MGERQRSAPILGNRQPRELLRGCNDRCDRPSWQWLAVSSQYLHVGRDWRVTHHLPSYNRYDSGRVHTVGYVAADGSFFRVHLNEWVPSIANLGRTPFVRFGSTTLRPQRNVHLRAGNRGRGVNKRFGL